VATAAPWSEGVWVAAERLPEMQAGIDGALFDPPIVAPPGRAAVEWTRESALMEIVRGRMALAGPIAPRQLGAPLGFDHDASSQLLLALEADGAVLRGWFSPGGVEEEWCDRRLLARIHRATLQRLRAEVQPVSQSDFMRFLFAWQHVDPSAQLTGLDGVRAVIGQLDGFELAADAWDRRILPSRVTGYDPSMLDLLCYSGEAAWARLSAPPAVHPSSILPPRPVRATPIALFRREHVQAWRALARHDQAGDPCISDIGREVLGVLAEKGARFVHEIAGALAADPGLVRDALAELVWAGQVASDGFAGLRAIWSDAAAVPRRLFRGRSMAAATSPGGRWSCLAEVGSGEWGVGSGESFGREAALEAYADALLRRYGIMCRRLMAREPFAVPWRELLQVYRRLEARGEVRGGRFVSGLPGEQFALPEAVELARQIRRTKPAGEPIVISAVDPLNLCGIITPGERIPAVASTQITFRDGSPELLAVDGSQFTVAS